jgi:hypothetical protein
MKKIFESLITLTVSIIVLAGSFIWYCFLDGGIESFLTGFPSLGVFLAWCISYFYDNKKVIGEAEIPLEEKNDEGQPLIEIENTIDDGDENMQVGVVDNTFLKQGKKTENNHIKITNVIKHGKKNTQIGKIERR